MIVTDDFIELHRRFALKEQLIDFFSLERYQEPFYFSTAAKQIINAGNRAGKTEIVAMKIVDIITHRHPTIHREGPVKVRVVGNIMRENVKRVIVDKLRKFIPSYALRGKSFDDSWNKLDGVIYLYEGSTIQLMSNDQPISAHRGEALDIVWFDEQPPAAIVDENLARLGDKDGIAIFSLTPEEGATFLHKRYTSRAKPGTNIEFFEFEMLKNPHINREYQVRELALLPDRKRRIKIFGDIINMEGLIFDEFDPKIHVVRPFMPPDGWQLFLGIDSGWSNPTAVTFWAIGPKHEIFQIDERYVTHETIEQTGEALRRTVDQKYGHLDFRFAVFDARSGRQTSRQTGVSDYQKFVRAFGKGPVYLSDCGRGAVENRNDSMHALLLPDYEHRWARYRVTSNCRNTIREFGLYCRDDKVDNDRNKSEKPKDKDNHSMDANGILAEKRPMWRQIAYPELRLRSQYRRGGII